MSKYEHILLKVDKEKGIKIIKEKTEVDKLAPSVEKLIKQISTKKINIHKITLIAADREKLLEQTNNPGMELEIHIVPVLEPH